METVKLKQGSPEWLAHRRQHFNASDAPAMLACSPYKTRTQLLHELKTGISPEVDAATQRRFDDGHRFEKLARPLAEEIIGEDLSPEVGVKGELSASFDGLTFSEDTAFEHKSLNDQLRAALMSDAGAEALPKHYRVQMEQQCMVSGATRVLFMASKWAGDELVEEMHAWYDPDAALRAEILAGWQQFAIDLAAYVPQAAVAPVAAAPIESLPAVSVRMDGQLAIASNLPEFGTALRAFIGRMVAKPETDQEFADAEAECKALKKAEDALEAAESSALAEMSDVEAMRRTVADLKTLARSTRLTREKIVAAEKDNRRLEIVQTGAAAYAAHVTSLNERLGRPYMPAVPVEFAGAIKGKKNLESMRDAVGALLAQSKIAANKIADRIDANLKHLAAEAADHSALFPDEASIALKATDDFAALVQFRLADFKAKEDKRKADELAKVAVVTEPIVASPSAPAPSVIAMPMRSAAPRAAAPTAPPALGIGTINERLQHFTVTEASLRGLGFEPAGRERAAPRYHEADFPHVLAALVAHIQSIQAKQAA